MPEGFKEVLHKDLREALKKTKSNSAPGPDNISYGLLKSILKTDLGESFIEELAEWLFDESSHIAWDLQKQTFGFKVVYIPKIDKDLRQAKGWRPINLINTTAKLVEKVVAKYLQSEYP